MPASSRPPPPPPHYVPEESVLLPTTEASNSDWPTFVLSDAIVYRPDGTTMANVLLINQEGPFTIRGRLEVDDDDDVPYLVDPRVRSAYIEIRDSKVYSIGYDPEAVIWLSGKAGWFELNPHPSYAAIYKDMCQVSHLDYVLAKIYEDEFAHRADHHNNKKRAPPPPKDIKEVLFQYAVALGDGITYEETIDKCVRLGPVLVSHMESSTGLPWKQTSIYGWLVRELKNRERSGRSSSRDAQLPDPAHAALPPSLQSPAQPQQLPYRASPAATTTATTTAAAAAAAAPATTVYAPAQASQGVYPAPPAALSARTMAQTLPPDETDAVFEIFLKTVEDIGRNINTTNKNHLTAGKVHASLHALYRLREYNTGKMLSAVFADRLVRALSPAWHGSPYVRYLESGECQTHLPASDECLRAIPDQLVRRNTMVSRSSQAAQSSPLTTHSNAGLPASSSQQSTPRTTTAGKRAVLRPPVSSARKRPFDGIGEGGGYDSDPSQQQPPRPRPVGRPRKTAKTHDPDPVAVAAAPAWPAPVDRSDADVAFHGEDEEEEDSEEDSEDDDDTVVAVHAVPLQVSTRPTGPNGTWECPQPGCRFLVRNAAGADRGRERERERERIQAHLRSHEQAALSRVDLAIAEGSRKHVSVDNLLAKIRALSDSKGGQGRPDGAGLPAATAGVGTSSSTLRRFLF